MDASTVLTTFPGKHIWVFCALIYNLCRLPFWAFYYIPQSFRPSPQWSYNQALRVRVFKAFLGTLSRIEVLTPHDLTPGAEASRFTIIHPARSDRYLGVTMSNFEIRPETLGGTWYPNRPTNASAAGDVVLHFHGGAYVVGSGRPVDSGFTAKTIIANSTAAHVFCPQYRLASNPGGKFPAALQDAVTSYLYLVDTLRISPKRIVVSGDSAGGNLVLALLRYIHDNPEAVLPHPGCAWLWSPWTNPEGALTPGFLADNPRLPTDYMGEGFGAWGARCFKPLEGSGVTMAHPSICFLGTAFKTLTPLFISTGECELLFAENVKLYEEFKAVPGNNVELQIEQAAPHDIISVGEMLGFEKEVILGVRRAGEFWERSR
ncbi:alpha beta hydrolase fold-3 domain containing protein [Rutstroemia sp. NJR-2017a BVV2]|nr:alpha beta hydrolase fold-3 domain containing protein [Rutstroemia sp. NJR-2017a BVV2]